jgi:hypothetical protein
MVVGVVVVGLVVVQVVITENMNFVVDSAGTVDREKVGMVVDMAIDMAVGMADFLEHTLANLEEVGFGSAEEAKFSKAWVHSMILNRILKIPRKLLRELRSKILRHTCETWLPRLPWC